VLVRFLSELAPVPARTIVINVNTDLVATRALLSATEVVGDPVLLVNCDPTREGRRHFDRLMEAYKFDLVEAPLRSHGDTLDWLFTALADERILLLDSDAEVTDEAFVEWMRRMLDHPLTFGAGFTWGPFFIPEAWQAPPRAILYMERPWIPCVMFKTGPVRVALDAGYSFRIRYVANDAAFSRRLSRFLAARWGPPWGVWGVQSRRFDALPAWVRRRMSTMPLDGLRWARRSYHGVRPSVVHYDTGAEIFQYLRYDKEMLFAGVPMELQDGEVHHYSGVTRYSLFGPSVLNTAEADTEVEVVDRLATRYGYQWGERE
jgi:hypothetical protein